MEYIRAAKENIDNQLNKGMMDLSVCIITKNEKNRLKKCLDALKKCQYDSARALDRQTGEGFEIVVVDTGSTDGTKEMAASYTDRIFDFAWQDDFSLARNYAASKASHDMIMMLDSDEYVVEMDLYALAAAVKANRGMVGRIRRINLLERDGEQQEISEYISRIYDRTLYHYEGKIHEQITLMPKNRMLREDEPKENSRTYQTCVAVLHDGYCGSETELKAKVERNIMLLQRELKEKGDDPYLLYQLGKAYYVASDYEAAIGAFDRVLCQDLNPKLEYVIDMVQAYGYSLLKSGKEERLKQALSLEGIYDEFGNTADFCFLMGLIYMNNGLFDRAVKEFLAATKVREAYTKGANSYLAYYNAGVICECLEDFENARKYYAACGDYPRAKQRLEAIK